MTYSSNKPLNQDGANSLAVGDDASDSPCIGAYSTDSERLFQIDRER